MRIIAEVASLAVLWFELVYVNNWENVAITAAAIFAATAILCVGLTQIAHRLD